MVARRRFLSLLGGAALAPALGRRRTTAGLAVYASIGAELAWFDADVQQCALERRGSIRLPANVQYVWPHASRQFLYVASSDGGPGRPGANHFASTLTVDQHSGALTAHGPAVSLVSRPIHLTSDVPSAHLLIAYNLPSGLSVHRINSDGTLGAGVQQRAPIDCGVYAHQIRVAPSNRTAILVTRGNDAEGSKPEDPGALKVFSFDRGVLTPRASIAPGGGYGFGPRHLDFHPTQPWVYVSRERENAIDMFALDEQGTTLVRRFSRSTLSDEGRSHARQLAGTIHVHPNGRVVYVANRASSTVDYAGTRVFAGGENTLAAFAIDPKTGEPTPLQHAETHGFHARTFHIDPSGRLLVAAHIQPQRVRDGAAVRTVPACLSLFRIGGDGRLEYVRKYDVEVGADSMFWMGMLKR